MRHELAARIGPPGWRIALETVPREAFLGKAVYTYEPERGWVPVRRSEMTPRTGFAWSTPMRHG